LGVTNATNTISPGNSQEMNQSYTGGFLDINQSYTGKSPEINSRKFGEKKNSFIQNDNKKAVYW
jgi:hypothetical protein